MTRHREAIHSRFIALLARFHADERGSAVEFALVALPFFALLFAIIQTSLVIFASQALQTMTSDAARGLMTGQLQMAGTGVEGFRSALCNGSAIMFDCDKLMIQVQAFSDFAGADPDGFINADCFRLDPPPPSSCYVPGNAEDVVLVRVAYDWPFGLNLEDLRKKQTLVAIAAFRSEPY